jgi:HAD superfamily hydrolase (TIGR01484 family)
MGLQLLPKVDVRLEKPLQRPVFRRSIPFSGVPKNSYIFAFDLDGTFLQGNKKELENFAKLASSQNHVLVYVSGRQTAELDAIIEDYARQGMKIPRPDYYISSNGQYLYKNENGKLLADETWHSQISATDYNRDRVKSVMNDFIKQNQVNQKPAMLQFDYRPSEFNTEYLVDANIVKGLREKLSHHLTQNGIQARVIMDYVPPEDIQKSLPQLPEALQQKVRPLLDHKGGIYVTIICAANKSDAVEYLRNKLNVDKNHVVAAGNAGNDISLATSGYWFIMVQNAQKILKDVVETLNPAHIIQATKEGLAGINEGLAKIFSSVKLF